MSDPDTATRSVVRRNFVGWAVAIGATALVVRVLVITLVDPHVPAVGDANAYHYLANNLADGRGYIRPFDLLKFGRSVPTAEYPPMFPFFLSLFARLGARSVESQRVVMGVVGSGTVVLIAYVGRRVGGTAVGVVAGFLGAIYPMLFLPEATLMSESLFAFLLAAALLLTYLADDRPSVWRYVALGVVLGLATLTRAEAIVLAVFLVVPLVWRLADASVWRRIGMAALVLVVASVVVLPWTIRNARTFDAFVPVSNSLVQIVDGANCRLTYSGPYLGAWRSTFGTPDARGRECFEGFNSSEPGFDEAKAADRSRRDGLNYVRHHLGDLPKVAAARWLRTFALFRPGQQTQLEALEGRPLGWERAGTWMFWIMAPLAIGGIVVLVRRRATIWPLVLTLVVVSVSVVITYGTQRFRITAEPAILVFAAAALVAIASRLTGGRTPDLAPAEPARNRPPAAVGAATRRD